MGSKSNPSTLLRASPNMIKISVPGKIHLLGEHSVVYGKPAILTAINLRIYLTIKEKNDGYKKSPKIKDQQIIEAQNSIESIIKKRFDKKIPPYQLIINSQLPIGFGLGSSAAFSVALTKALFKLLKIPEDKNQLFEIAQEGEKLFHGNPSGGDVAVVLNEGLIWFRKGPKGLLTTAPLFMDPRFRGDDVGGFLLINSGKPVESTADMVRKVASLRSGSSRRSNLVNKIFNEQEELTKKLAQALKNGDENLLINCIREGERNLEKLGVVGKKAKNIIKKIEKLDGAAKISGAGGIKKGSGMILCFHKNPQIILAFAKENNLETFKIKIGE